MFIKASSEKLTLPLFLPSEREVAEQALCRTVVEALPRGRFAHGLHAGCGRGLLTRHLASGCDTLIATDEDAAALADAETRCEDQPWVQFVALPLEAEWPDAGFTLIVLEDALMRRTVSQRRMLAARSMASLAPGGTILLLTRRRGTEEETAADLFIGDTRPRLSSIGQVRLEGMRLDTLR